MDGLSVAASCIAVIQAADQTYKIISQFRRDCKDAKSDSVAVSQELSTLIRTLTQLKDLVPDGSDFANSDLANNTKRDIQNIVSSCLVVASDIEDVLSGHEGKLAALSWATRGKRKVATSKVLFGNESSSSQSGCRYHYAVTTAQNIKQDTANILDDTTHMRGDIYDLVVRIRNLEAMVADKDPDDPRKYVLMRYLNDLSSVAASVCDMSSRPATPESDTSESILDVWRQQHWRMDKADGLPRSFHTPCCILPLSPNWALFVQQTGGDGASIVKVVKTTDPEGKPKLVCKSGFLPQSREVKKGLFTFSHMDQTITTIRHVERSAILYTWKLHGDWFTDADVTRQAQEPRRLLLPE
ncbi:uncharacterized protein FSUBG_4669 [Fusarium subglutinans]|uniref:Fungal N-terminal domain-containing protein n=1 Tax=Gibberella subglutinans TaxID=42677 RepID=A0A8H5Q6M4_GIBSU|nr:uncharacterized protein FSUBG_4669 [Fusarium subglutinans]KAF5608451.1 hypothetical protein FSUBG_4669 [Fusarium subglutinans]